MYRASSGAVDHFRKPLPQSAAASASEAASYREEAIYHVLCKNAVKFSWLELIRAGAKDKGNLFHG